MLSSCVGLLPALQTMQKDLEERFDFVTNPASARFDSTYIVATALDPRYNCMLKDDQLSIAKAHLANEVSCKLVLVLL